MFRQIRHVLFLFMLLSSSILADGECDFFRAIHMGGNWGRNTFSVQDPPQEYFNFLDSVNVNWVGISVALHIEDSMDSTVERVYSGVGIPTFRDEDLIRVIREFKDRHFNVYLTLAFETAEAEHATHPVKRWQLGDPKMHEEDPNVQLQYWPWALEHPEHDQFVQKFWESYTDQAIHFAEICETEGVGLYSLGTETNRLFRTRTEGYWPNNYLRQLSAMIDTVRTVYSGILTYDMQYGACIDTGFFSLGELWSDLDLDVIGVSAYFPLTQSMPDTIMRKEQLTQSWNKIFNENLIPLQNKNPDKPILFLEFGYVDAIGSPHMPGIREFENKFLEDSDHNGLDDGEETQSNVYETFFNVNQSHSNMIKGAFLWGNQMASDIDWANSFGQLRNFSLRNKLAQNIVSDYYAGYLLQPNIPTLLSPLDNSYEIASTCTLTWHSSLNTTSYRVQIARDTLFTVGLKDKNIGDTLFIALDLPDDTRFYWRVKAKNRSIESNWSNRYTFNTEPETSICDLPREFKLDHNYPNPFNPITAISFRLPVNSKVELSIYDINGRKITTLVSSSMPAGYHKVNWDASDYSSGIYFLQLQAGFLIDTKKMILLK